jgi:hypothetical protein
MKRNFVSQSKKRIYIKLSSLLLCHHYELNKSLLIMTSWMINLIIFTLISNLIILNLNKFSTNFFFLSNKMFYQYKIIMKTFQNNHYFVTHFDIKVEFYHDISKYLMVLYWFLRIVKKLYQYQYVKLSSNYHKMILNSFHSQN